MKFVQQEPPEQVGLVIQFEDGRVETFCLDVEGEITGADLLLRSGLDVVMDPASSMGVTICQIEGQGCDFPTEHCFCRCMGGSDCAYWNYFYREPGEAAWTYSNLGAGVHRVAPGSVEAWVWGDGHSPPADDLTFEAICAPPPPTPTLTPTAAPAATPTPTAAPAQPTAAPSPTAPPTAPPPTPTSPPPPPPATGPDLSAYWPFALALLALVAVAIAARRRT
ncbi:MAG TPA: hypothetical protein ENJ31_13965 [Anaerolineae bacterium]|nr:hypothetical protein [Anaerolineae bacterium]